MTGRVGWTCFLILVVSGCGGSGPRTLTPDTKGQELLAGVGDLYRQYSFSKKKPPEKLADLKAFEAAIPGAFNSIQDGTIIVRYGATMPNTEEGPPTGSSDEVLAYEKQVPESGGQVLMLNRETRKLTAEEFKAAKKAGKD